MNKDITKKTNTIDTTIKASVGLVRNRQAAQALLAAQTAIDADIRGLMIPVFIACLS